MKKRDIVSMLIAIATGPLLQGFILLQCRLLDLTLGEIGRLVLLAAGTAFSLYCLFTVLSAIADRGEEE